MHLKIVFGGSQIYTVSMGIPMPNLNGDPKVFVLADLDVQLTFQNNGIDILSSNCPRVDGFYFNIGL